MTTATKHTRESLGLMDRDKYEVTGTGVIDRCHWNSPDWTIRNNDIPLWMIDPNRWAGMGTNYLFIEPSGEVLEIMSCTATVVKVRAYALTPVYLATPRPEPEPLPALRADGGFCDWCGSRRCVGTCEANLEA